MQKVLIKIYHAKSFNQDLSSWNTSNVINMSSMFMWANNFNGDISTWDTSNVKDMISMFDGASSFNQNISSWNTSNVENMHAMFYDAENFNQDISAWDISKVKNTSFMFMKAKKFSADISSWNISSVIYMTSMFNRTENFNCDLSCWDISNVKSVAYMFAYALLFDYDLSSWHISRECATDNMFIGSPIENNKPYWYANIEYYNKQNEKTKHIKDRFVPLNKNELQALVGNDSISLNDIDISHVSDFSELFKYSERSDFKGIELWNVEHVKNMNEMFYKIFLMWQIWKICLLE